MTGRVSFRWARIGNGGLEPVALKTIDGKRMAFTIGCPDGFELAGDTAVKVGDKLEPPYEMMTDAEQAREDRLAARREAAYRKLHPTHGYAGFGRARP